MITIEAEYTEENFVKFGEAYDWATMFRDMGLDGLPDPDKEFEVDALEDWLCRALVARGMGQDVALETIRNAASEMNNQ